MNKKVGLNRYFLCFFNSFNRNSAKFLIKILPLCRTVFNLSFTKGVNIVLEKEIIK